VAGAGAPAGLQNRRGVAAPRWEGSTPSPLRYVPRPSLRRGVGRWKAERSRPKGRERLPDAAEHPPPAGTRALGAEAQRASVLRLVGRPVGGVSQPLTQGRSPSRRCVCRRQLVEIRAPLDRHRQAAAARPARRAPDRCRGSVRTDTECSVDELEFAAVVGCVHRNRLRARGCGGRHPAVELAGACRTLSPRPEWFRPRSVARIRRSSACLR
jgi:hypothetical protein